MSDRFNRLMEVVATLRSPDGCPWDRKQTLYSMREDFLEEAYELVAAMDNKDIPNMKEELGDVLLHVVMHSQIAAEDGLFDMDSVMEGVTEKLIRRHPHVFADESVNDSDEVVTRWEAIKAKERNAANADKSILAKADKPAPPLVKAMKLQASAAKVGFDWPSPADVLEKATEELDEIKKAVKMADKAHIEEEIGDMLFVLVNLARHYNLSAEKALEEANKKFARRFRYIEEELAKQGKTPAESSLEDMDAIWNEIRKKDKIT